MICTFPLFLATWNASQGFTTPRVHMKIAKWLVQPIQTPDGQSVWPERYPLHHIHETLRKTGPALFASQMMCQPVNSRDARLDSSLLQFYSEEITTREAHGIRHSTVCGRKLLSVSAWWDPSFGKAGGDRSMLAIVYTDEVGEYWLHHLAQITVNPNSDKDEATQQCEQVAELAKRFHLRSVALETNGLGKFLPGILRRELGVCGAVCAIKEITSRKVKATRITEAFDAPLAARAIHVHRSVLTTPFVKEMEDWRPDKRGGHDDCLDAVAGAISLEPIRIGKIPIAENTERQWVAMPPKRKAKTDFDV